MHKVKHIRQKIKMGIACGLAAAVVMLEFPVGAKFEGLVDRYEVVINGEVVGVAEDLEQAQAAYETARLTLNSQSDSLTLLKTDINYKPARVRASEVMCQPELAQAIYNTLTGCMIWDKTLAYTLKVNNYTVTLGSEAEVLEVLERVQGTYDAENEFEVALEGTDEQDNAMGTTIINASKTANNPEVLTSDENGETVPADGSADVGEDGVLSVDFQEEIEVIETYATPDQLKDVQTAYEEITKDHANNEVYSVQSGDCLSSIADQYGLSIDELLALNDGMTVDSNILVGDQIVVQVPKPELSVISTQQMTYTEDYEAEVQYIDNPDVYVGNDTVVQEPSTGNRTVTAVVTYKNGVETNREIIKEQVNVEAVAKIVERGTMPLPTYIRPTTYGVMTSGFGPRWGTMHKGMDFGVPVGTAARASRAGTVVSAGWAGGYGYCVLIDHGDGVRTRYAHLSQIQCSVGQYVNQGDVIALTGNTGDSTGPHIHFEIIINGTPVNPAGYI